MLIIELINMCVKYSSVVELWKDDDHVYLSDRLASFNFVSYFRGKTLYLVPSEVCENQSND